MPQRLAGQLVDGGDPVADEPVFVVDTGPADESNWSIVATDRSAADGSWSVTVPNADPKRYHAVAQFEDGETLKNALSKPFLTSQPFAQANAVSVGFDVLSPAVSVGSAIPDSDVYLHDDWGDNKLQNRDGSGTTTYNGVEGVYRPEWVIIDNEPTVENERVVVEVGGGIQTSINLNLDETITWEWVDIDPSNSGSSGSDWISTYCFSNNTIEVPETPESYYLRVRPDDAAEIQLREVDSGGSSTIIISGSGLDGPSHDITVTRSSDGEWELFIDGVSEGTATETSHTNPNSTGFVSNDNGQVSFDEVKVS